MAKNWKHTKKLLEGLLCDKLKDRITYQLHCYRPDDDWTGHLEILLDKKPIFIHYDAILWIKTGNIIRPAAFL